VWVLTRHDLAHTVGHAHHYLVAAAPGALITNGVLRGAGGGGAGALAAGNTPAWSDEGVYGPFHAGTATISVQEPEAAVNQSTTVTLDTLYPLNLGLIMLAGPGDPTYSVANGSVQKLAAATRFDYYFGVQFYPASWRKNGDGHWQPGRYFDTDFVEWYDHLSVIAGFSLSQPTQQALLALAYEVVPGISLTAGWEPRQVQHLISGFTAAETVAGSGAPVEMKWQTGWPSFGFGLTVDASIAQSLMSVLGGSKGGGSNNSSSPGGASGGGGGQSGGGH
jgi:hypothetical protein